MKTDLTHLSQHIVMEKCINQQCVADSAAQLILKCAL